MTTWILLTALVTAADPDFVEVAPREAHNRILNEAQTGSLIVSRGDCLAIKIYSASRYTHVAAVVMRDDEAFVYDATGGAGVRKLPLCEYLAAQNDATLYLFHPRRPFSEKCSLSFEQHLERQLGRPYAIKHHLTGERAAGLHCAEYVTDALMAAELLRATQPSRVSPAALVEGTLKAGIYNQATTLRLVPEPVTRSESTSWCAQIWFDTKQCTQTCYRKLRGWVCCK